MPFHLNWTHPNPFKLYLESSLEMKLRHCTFHLASRKKHSSHLANKLLNNYSANPAIPFELNLSQPFQTVFWTFPRNEIETLHYLFISFDRSDYIIWHLENNTIHILQNKFF